MPEKTSLALIVPCYNESRSIPLFEAELEKFHLAFKSRFPESELAVIVVDNNSADGSYQLLEPIAARLDYVRLERCGQQGYGAALKHGFAIAEAEYLSFLDLDNTYPMLHLLELLRTLQQENLDIVYGARLHANSDISLVRKSGNLFYVYLLKFFFNSSLTDVCSGMRIFKSAFKAQVLELKANDLSFSIEFTAQALSRKWNIAERPVPYRDRVGESKLSVIKDGLLFLGVVLRKVIQKAS